MISATQLLSTPQAYDIQKVLKQQPQLIGALVDYITVFPDPLLMNQVECYMFPQRSAQILCLGMNYQFMVLKKQKKDPKTGETIHSYPFLERLFNNIFKQQDKGLQQILMGYMNRVLVSLVKKTPQIYEFLKDNAEIMTKILISDSHLTGFMDFLVIFLVESTMELYLFLKNTIIRVLMSRLIDGQDSIVLYETIRIIYDQITIKHESAPQEDKEELAQLKKNFEQQDFVNLLILKISPNKTEITFHIARILNSLLAEKKSLCKTLQVPHFEHVNDFFEDFQESSNFMYMINRHHLEVLAFLCKVIQIGLQNTQSTLLENKQQQESEAKRIPTDQQMQQFEVQLLKRLLVYYSVHQNANMLQVLLWELINKFLEFRPQVFNQVNFITFLNKNQESSKLRYSLRAFYQRVCKLWYENESLMNTVNPEQKNLIQSILNEKNLKLKDRNYFGKTDFIPRNINVEKRDSGIKPQANLASQKSQNQTQKEVKQFDDSKIM